MTGGDFDDTPWFNVSDQLPRPIPSADVKRLPPDRLRIGGRGHRFWNAVTELKDDKPVYVLRPDEMFLLEEITLAMDRLEQMDRDIDKAAEARGDLYMTGSAGGTVANPLLVARRGLATQVAVMVKQLALPDVTAPAARSGATSQREHQSNAAKARWGKKPATG